MNLISSYEAAIARGELVDDPLQRKVLDCFQVLSDKLDAPKPWYKAFSSEFIQGIYLVGPVGGGKTYLMDLFFNGVQEKKKIRLHFSQFVQQIDLELRASQGKANPLQHLAKQWAKTTRLLCLDEFLVHDVAEAMILAELLEALFAQGVVLVCTSNTLPDDLYLHGVRRERFLPAIALIKKHCELLLLQQDVDYRRGRLRETKAYLSPLSAAVESLMLEQFQAMAGERWDGVELDIQNRTISTITCSSSAVWFEFNTLCAIPRSQADYLEIASRFKVVFLSNIPCLREDELGVVLLVRLIDVLYDQRLILVASAAAKPSELVQPMPAWFARTLSRLEEMQSKDYLQRYGHFLIQSTSS